MNVHSFKKLFSEYLPAAWYCTMLLELTFQWEKTRHISELENKLTNNYSCVKKEKKNQSVKTATNRGALRGILTKKRIPFR